jgi:UDP:flavonoid glycosyltransferase YjiC (YdhE family)
MSLNDEAFSQYNIITAGDKQKVLGASHINSYDFIDFNSILPKINLIICHGGNGTLNQAYQFNVPFIAIPSIFEQEWNAARFQEVTRGKMITKRPTTKQLKSLVELMLNNH